MSSLPGGLSFDTRDRFMFRLKTGGQLLERSSSSLIVFEGKK